MNALLKQLEQQCWSHRIDGILVDGHLHFDINKFAHLIVEECRSAVVDVYRNTPLEACGYLIAADEEIAKRFYGSKE